MGFSACVHYQAKPGHGEQVQEIMLTLRRHTLEEPGCLAYEPHRDPDDPVRFFLFECYADEAAYAAHQATEHFRRYAREDLAEHLVDRQVERFETLAATPLTR